MKVVAIASMKGGVGKTTTTANLASSFLAEKLAQNIVVVDLDPQNALHLHFDILSSAQGNEGICSYGVRQLSLKGLLDRSSSGIGLIPYGAATEVERQAFEDILQADPGWLGRRLAEMNLPKDSVVLIDTPPGSTPYLQQAFDIANVALLLILSDAASYLTLPSMENWIGDTQRRHPALLSAYVINQTENGRPLQRDLLDVLRHRLGKRLAPVGIHRDEAVPEALAFRQSVIDYDAYSQASQDIRRLTVWLGQQLENF